MWYFLSTDENKLGIQTTITAAETMEMMQQNQVLYCLLNAEQTCKDDGREIVFMW